MQCEKVQMEKFSELESSRFKEAVLLVTLCTSLGTQRCPEYSRRLPALGRFYRETKFSLLKSTNLTENLKTKLRKFPWLSRVSQSKFEANRSRIFELRYTINPLNQSIFQG